MSIIKKGIMSYKNFLKKWEEISVRLRIIKYRVYEKWSIQALSTYFSMHRNSVRNIMLLYESEASEDFKYKIIHNISFSSEELSQLWTFLVSQSRRPHSHSRQASFSQEQKIRSWYEKTKVWAKRLRNNLE